MPYNKLLTNLASSSHTGKYWPSVVFVRCARSVLPRPRINIPQYCPRARLVRGYYLPTERSAQGVARDLTSDRQNSFCQYRTACNRGMIFSKPCDHTEEFCASTAMCNVDNTLSFAFYYFSTLKGGMEVLKLIL